MRDREENYSKQYNIYIRTYIVKMCIYMQKAYRSGIMFSI